MGEIMENKIKVLGILLLAGFSFFYTNKVTDIIKDNDPIMSKIKETKKDIVVSKIDPVIINDEYITGINGCIVDENESYNKMKNEGEYKEELLVMKEDEVKQFNDKYIIGGNKKKRNVSIILLDIDNKLDNYIKKNNISINYFLDGKYIVDNIDKIIGISKHSNIYNYGRNEKYTSKYIVYDNSIISTNLSNNSDYCLFKNKDKEGLKICSSYDMKSIKEEVINDDFLTYTKENLKNGKIYIYDNYNYEEIELSIKYILSKGYNIVLLDELLSESNNCR